MRFPIRDDPPITEIPHSVSEKRYYPDEYPFFLGNGRGIDYITGAGYSGYEEILNLLFFCNKSIFLKSRAKK